MSTDRKLNIGEVDITEKVQQMRVICTRILDLAKSKGATSAEVGVSQDMGLSVQVRNGDVETLEFNQDASFGISVYKGQQKGCATTTDTSDAAIDAAVEAACNIARFTSADPFAGLADAELMADNIFDLEIDYPVALSPEECIDSALRCEASALATDKSIRQSDGASMSSHRFARVYANSHGFIADMSSTRNSLSCVVIAQDENGMQRDYWYTLSRQLKQLQAPEEVGRIAAERTLKRLGARVMKTQKVPVLFSPEVARGLLGHFFGAIRGGALYRKSTFLLDSLGQQIFPEFLTIKEQPHRLGGLASSCFDNEGVTTYERDIVTGGVVQGYILNSYSARKLGMKTTANAGGLHNVEITDTGHDLEALLKQMGTGLFVTDVMGQGVNLVSGDYSRGASGFWVEKGEIQFPVHEVTIAGHLADMFKNIVAVGNDRDKRSSVVTGSFLVEGMTLAGN